MGELIEEGRLSPARFTSNKDDLPLPIYCPIEARSEILSQASGATAIFLTSYAAVLQDTLRAQLSRQKDNDLLALNAAVCLAHLRQRSSCPLQEELLKHKSTAARYWAVKGLGVVLADWPGSADDPDAARIVRTLAAAGAKESSSLVLAQIYAALPTISPQGI